MVAGDVFPMWLASYQVTLWPNSPKRLSGSLSFSARQRETTADDDDEDEDDEDDDDDDDYGAAKRRQQVANLPNSFPNNTCRSVWLLKQSAPLQRLHERTHSSVGRVC